MTLDFHTSYNRISQRLIKSIRNEMAALARINSHISRAEVSLRANEQPTNTLNKVCTIKLTVYGDDLMVYARAENFENSVKGAIKNLWRLSKQPAKKQKNSRMKLLPH